MRTTWFRIREWFADRFYRDPGDEARVIHLQPSVTADSTAIVNAFGYALVIFSLVEYANILIPLQLTNSQWEFETFGRLVENVWGFVIGFAFIFFRTDRTMRKLHLRWLSFLSWLVLLMGILYFLMVPLTILNAWRLDRQVTQNYQAALTQGEQRFGNIREALTEGNVSQQDLQNLQAALRLPFDENAPIEQQILGAVEQRQSQTVEEIDRRRQTWRRSMLRNAVKWNIGAILIGFSMSWLWFLTRGLRRALQLEG